MNILILGSGGREHTFAYKISKSAKCNKDNAAIIKGRKKWKRRKNKRSN